MAESDRDDAVTVGAIGLVAYVVADLAHHVLGHAAACVALGGRLQSLTSTHVTCSVTGAAVDLAGPAANLVVGLAAWGLATVVRASGARLFLLLCAAFNLLWLEGQLIYSAAARRDDWDQLILMLTPREAWRWGLAALGLSAYIVTVRALGPALRNYAFPSPARLKRLMGLAYVAAGLAAVAAGLRDPDGAEALIYRAIPQALLLPIGILFIRGQGAPPASDRIRFAPGWLVLASAALVGSVIWLGPGIA